MAVVAAAQHDCDITTLLLYCANSTVFKLDEVAAWPAIIHMVECVSYSPCDATHINAISKKYYDTLCAAYRVVQRKVSHILALPNDLRTLIHMHLMYKYQGSRRDKLAQLYVLGAADFPPNIPNHYNMSAEGIDIYYFLNYTVAVHNGAANIMSKSHTRKTMQYAEFRQQYPTAARGIDIWNSLRVVYGKY